MPSLYRTIFQVTGLDPAVAFYSQLLGQPGRRVADTRHYFDCGPVILALVDEGANARPNPDYTYFATSELEALHSRCRALDCLVAGDVHGEPAGEIAVRPWGERSFYARDPLGSGLCFVDEGTLFTGL